MKLKVIATTPYWSLNGVNSFSSDLVRGLSFRGIDARILLTDPDPFRRNPMPMDTDIPFDVLAVHRKDSIGLRRASLVRYLEAESPCVYLPNYDYAYSCVTPLLSEGVRVLGIIHSDDPEHYEHARRLGPGWDGIVCVSRAIREEVLTAHPGWKDKAYLISYGVDIRGRERARTNARSRLKIIYAGRMETYQKRVLDIVSVARKLREREIPCEWTFAGCGQNLPELKRRFEKLGQEGVRFRFTGTVTRPLLRKIFSEQDVFILTSKFEGLPVAMLEAMAEGCVPVVTGIRSGIPEVIREGVNGFTAPVGDAGKMADNITRLYHEPDTLAGASQEARRTIRAFYSTERMADEYTACFQRLWERGSSVRKDMQNRKVLPAPLFPSDPSRLPSLLKTVASYCKERLKKTIFSSPASKETS